MLTLPESEREAARTHFAVFVVHNKLKPKLGAIPDDVPCVLVSLPLFPSTRPPPFACMLCHTTIDPLFHDDRYYAGDEVDDLW